MSLCMLSSIDFERSHFGPEQANLLKSAQVWKLIWWSSEDLISYSLSVFGRCMKCPVYAMAIFDRNQHCTLNNFVEQLSVPEQHKLMYSSCQRKVLAKVHCRKLAVWFIDHTIIKLAVCFIDHTIIKCNLWQRVLRVTHLHCCHSPRATDSLFLCQKAKASRLNNVWRSGCRHLCVQTEHTVSN